jgi:hypothetical protein
VEENAGTRIAPHCHEIPRPTDRGIAMAGVEFRNAARTRRASDEYKNITHRRSSSIKSNRGKAASGGG